MSLGDVLGARRSGVLRVGGIRVDESAWPRVVLTWPGGARPDAELTAALRALSRIARRKEPHVLLVDALDARAPTATQLGMILELARGASPGMPCVAGAVVTRSPGVRAIVDSLRWMHLTLARWEHFDDLELAAEWLARELRERAPSAAQPSPSPVPRAAASACLRSADMRQPYAK